MTELQQAVIDQLGLDAEQIEAKDGDDYSTLSDIASHDASAGWTGFTYYADTVEFWEKNRLEIRKLLSELADEIGESVIDLVASFGCLRDFTRTDAGKKDLSAIYEIGEVIYSGRCDDEDAYYTIANALSWYALEAVARELTD